MNHRLAALSSLVLVGTLDAAEIWPVIIDLKHGPPQEIRVAGPAGEVQRRIRLLRVQEFSWPNRALADAPDRQVFQSAEVEVEVGGTQAILRARPFESPRLVNGLR
ncbi:MAG TPA: hypothetical protein PKM43_06250, partial [Verrucomicrobiota bacterium]|nr:hypothetical protein [Verrucomicrobiota bacterium]